MRAMIEKEKPPRDLWDLKLVPGGLIDLEFIAQVAVLTGGVEPASATDRDRRKSWRGLRRVSPIRKIRQELCDAYALYPALTQIMRLCLTGPFERDDVPPGLSDLLLRRRTCPISACWRRISRRRRRRCEGISTFCFERSG